MTHSRTQRVSTSTNPPTTFTPGNRRFLPPVPGLAVNPINLLDEPTPQIMGNRSSHFRRVSGNVPKEQDEEKKDVIAPKTKDDTWDDADIIVVGQNNANQADDVFPAATESFPASGKPSVKAQREETVPAALQEAAEPSQQRIGDAAPLASKSETTSGPAQRTQPSDDAANSNAS